MAILMTMELFIVIPDATSQIADWQFRFKLGDFFSNEKTNFDAVIWAAK
jgi:hypothetical protein